MTGIVLVGAALAASIGAIPAAAHGSTQEPASRTYACRFESPNNPMCAAAWSANSQALYDWMEVNIGDANGRHRELIPDGRLCGAGRDKYAAFNQPGAWPLTALRTDASGFVNLDYENTAPHSTAYYRVYLTRPGFDARTDSLGWGDLELAFDSGPLDRAPSNRLRVPLPARDVPAILYVVWQRSDSPEAFYACSDVTVNAGVAGPAPTTPAPTTPSPTTAAPTTAAPTTAAPTTASPTTGPPATSPPTTAAPVIPPSTVAPPTTGTRPTTTTPTTKAPSSTPATAPTAALPPVTSASGAAPSNTALPATGDTTAADAEAGGATSVAEALIDSSEEQVSGATITEGGDPPAQIGESASEGSGLSLTVGTPTDAIATGAGTDEAGSSRANRWLLLIGSVGVISSGLLLLGTRLRASGREIWTGTVARMLADGA